MPQIAQIARDLRIAAVLAADRSSASSSSSSAWAWCPRSSRRSSCATRRSPPTSRPRAGARDAADEPGRRLSRARWTRAAPKPPGSPPRPRPTPPERPSNRSPRPTTAIGAKVDEADGQIARGARRRAGRDRERRRRGDAGAWSSGVAGLEVDTADGRAPRCKANWSMAEPTIAATAGTEVPAEHGMPTPSRVLASTRPMVVALAMVASC